MIDYDNIKKTEKWLKKRSQILDVQKIKTRFFKIILRNPKMDILQKTENLAGFSF